MKKICRIEGRGIVVSGNDIDTDQVIPARYMKEVTFEGIEKYAFYDLRYDPEGNKKEHPFNDEKYKGANILIVNSNFGCGSSREHAPQTLMRSGIDAIIGESFAEIFSGNCMALGVPAIMLEKKSILEIQNIIQNTPQTPISIDIEQSKIVVGEKVYVANIAPQIQSAFISGIWDTTNVMLSHEDEIARVYNALPYIKGKF